MSTKSAFFILLLAIGNSPSLANERLLPDKGEKTLQHQRFSSEVGAITARIVLTGNNDHLPFLVVDKMDARVYLFQADGQLRGTTAALLGLKVGDTSVAGIGKRRLSSIRPEERTTPAGRFIASLGRNSHGKQILWVDYQTALSLHPVITSNPKEHRTQRLESASPLDNRISYGCINVSADFFNQMVLPAFSNNNGVVYVLPETLSLDAVFPELATKAGP